VKEWWFVMKRFIDLESGTDDIEVPTPWPEWHGRTTIDAGEWLER